jgi:hypothetical protein
MRKSQRPQRLLKRGLVSTGSLPSPNSATPQIQDDRVSTSCPQCGAELQAAVKIYLCGVEVNSAGLVIKYDGRPQPENEDDILELCDLQNTTVYCANDHIISPDGTVRTKSAQPPDALQVLRRIAAWPANSNSEPDVMGDALDEIQELASRTVELLAPPKR